MTSGFQFRRAAIADLEFLLSLRRQTMWEHFENSGVEIDEAAQHAKVLHHFDCAEIVTRDTKDIGLLKVRREGDPWELVQIQLRPEYQGQGIGAQLVSAVLDDAAAAGVGVVLDVLKANPARRLYERLGFRIAAEREHDYLMRFERRDSAHS